MKISPTLGVKTYSEKAYTTFTLRSCDDVQLLWARLPRVGRGEHDHQRWPFMSGLTTLVDTLLERSTSLTVYKALFEVDDVVSARHIVLQIGPNSLILPVPSPRGYAMNRSRGFASLPDERMMKTFSRTGVDVLILYGWSCPHVAGTLFRNGRDVWVTHPIDLVDHQQFLTVVRALTEVQ